ncbi:hypothetical protein MPSD_47610 [Mycobacterium pseudoshottsii JCM 15466]|nr:hypothetical protein MPSD_47610 [Mycobacterium pseudoshottsii JCM 15466]
MDTPDFAPAAAAVVGDVVAVSLVEEEAAVVGGEAVWGAHPTRPAAGSAIVIAALNSCDIRAARDARRAGIGSAAKRFNDSLSLACGRSTSGSYTTPSTKQISG